MESARDAFKRMWAAQFAGRACPVPDLRCWNDSGQLLSVESLRDELRICHKRIEELRERIIEEEFLERYCQQKLSEYERRVTPVGNESAIYAAVLRKSTKSFKEKITTDCNKNVLIDVSSNDSLSDGSLVRDNGDVRIETIYASPMDCQPVKLRPDSEEVVYAEPMSLDVTEQHSAPTVHVLPVLPPKTEEMLRREIFSSKGNDSTDSAGESIDEPSSDDESLATLVALRQSVCRQSQYCVDSGSARQQLEKQAMRLSTRFSCMLEKKNLLSSNGLDLPTVEESLFSPSILSPTPGLLSGQDNEPDWLFTSSEVAVDDQLQSDQSELVNPSANATEMRKWIITTLLDSEKTYLQTLESLLNWWNVHGTRLQALSELGTLFELYKQLCDCHRQFLNDLSPVIVNWHPNNSVGEALKLLAVHEYAIAPRYLKDYQRSLTIIGKYRREIQDFDEAFKAQMNGEKSNLEELLHKPVIRFERNTLVLHDLIKYTPTGHADYDLLQKSLKLARCFLEKLVSPDIDPSASEYQRYLVRHGLIVEKLGKDRKLRHVFLFNDVIVCAKQKLARTKDQYEIKWFVPLVDLSLEDKILSQEDKKATDDHKKEVEALQRRVSDLQYEYKQEMRKNKDPSENKPRLLRRNKSLERLRKKLMEQEVALVIAMPHLAFCINNRRQAKQFMLMMSSDYERSDWREAIAGLLEKAHHLAQALPALTVLDVQNLLAKSKSLSLKQSGTALDRDSLFVEEERLFGSLHVVVLKMQSLKRPTRVFCRIEVDSFGHFLTKAKTNVSTASQDPTWNEKFEVDLDGAQTLRVLCYSQDKVVEELLGKGAIELSSVWLKGDYHEQAIALLNNELTLFVSLKYLSHDQTIQRCISPSCEDMFGASLKLITEREGSNIPQVVTVCINEIESRGLDEEGLYRISGLATVVEELKEDFKKNDSPVLKKKLKNVDIHVLTNVVKMFFRNLPDPLFTEHLYGRFAEGIGLADPDAKDRCIMTLVCSLPAPNFATAMFLIDHLIKVSKHEVQNKMTLKNIATVFGPTVLRPAKRTSQQKTIEQLFFLAAHDAMVQTTVLLHILTMRLNGTEFVRFDRDRLEEAALP